MCEPEYQAAYRISKGLGTRGEPLRSGPIEYRAAHFAVERARGKARTYFCVDCYSRAFEWSLIADATDVLVSTAEASAGKKYSLNVDDYEPRCSSCHRTYDKALARE